MRILGVDPGLQTAGFGVIDVHGMQLDYVASGTIRTDVRQSLPQRLKVLFEGVREVVARYQPDTSAVEIVFVNNNPRWAWPSPTRMWARPWSGCAPPVKNRGRWWAAMQRRRWPGITGVGAAAEGWRTGPHGRLACATFSNRRHTMSKVLLVTGGSRGIGAATALLAAQDGWTVAVNYASQAQAAQEVVQQIRAWGGQALAVQADVANESQVLAMFSLIDAQLGPLSGLVNNAGVVDVTARLDEMSSARIRRMFDINVMGSMVCAREAVRRMSTRHGGGGGSIVNVSSAATRLGSAGQYVDYAASKGAIDAFTIGLAKEVAAEGIRVNAVRPGLIDTDIHASGGLPTRVSDLQHLVPAQRGGTAQEVAQGIVWLLSDKASYTTMSFLDISGGR